MPSAAFPDKRIIIPEDAGMSVLKGAVLFGHRPDFILSRVMKCSYGVKTNIPFDKRRHDVKQKVLMDGEEKCDNISIKIVDRPFVELLETVFFIKVMMLSIVGVKSLIIKSASNLNLSLNIVIT
jgi:hypothetical protein